VNILGERVPVEACYVWEAVGSNQCWFLNAAMMVSRAVMMALHACVDYEAMMEPGVMMVALCARVECEVEVSLCAHAKHVVMMVLLCAHVDGAVMMV
jgi:hypothetical protein